MQTGRQTDGQKGTQTGRNSEETDRWKDNGIYLLEEKSRETDSLLDR